VLNVTLTEKLAFIESVFGPYTISAKCVNVEVWCPVCKNKNNKKKLSIKLENDLNHCWLCGWAARSLAPLLAKYSTRDKLEEYKRKYRPTAKETSSEEVKKQEAILPNDFRLLTESTDSRDPDTRAIYRYLRIARGLSDRDLWFYKIGYSNEFKWQRRAIVPSFDVNGNVNYYIGRTIDDKVRPKYDNPNVDKNPIIFNEINIDFTQASERLVICEGVFDMFKCGNNAVPLLGSDINEQSALFDAILVNNKSIALALDGDMWETKTPKLAKKFTSYNIDVVIVDTRSFSDPGSASKQQFADALSIATPYSWESNFTTKLNRASQTTMAY
jgi:hypothetical protein